MQSFVETKIKRKSGEDALVDAIFLILMRLKGHSLQDVLDMYVTQFYVLLDKLNTVIKHEQKQARKSRRRR